VLKRNFEIGLDNKPFSHIKPFIKSDDRMRLEKGCCDQRLERYIAFKGLFYREIKIINAIRITMKRGNTSKGTRRGCELRDHHETPARQVTNRVTVR